MADQSSKEAVPQPPAPAPAVAAVALATADAPVTSKENNDASSASETAKEQTEEPKAKESFFTYFHLLFYADPTWLDYVLIVLGTIVAAAAGTPFPLMGILFGQLVDDMNGATCANEENTTDPVAAQKAVNDKVLMLVYISAGALALIYAYFLMWSVVSQRLAHRLREKYFQSLLKQDATFFDKRQAGEVSSRLNADISLIQSGTSEKVGIFIATISFFVTAYVVGFVKYAKLAGILVSLVPAFLAMAIICGGFVQKYSGKMSDGIASASSIASEALSHVAVVQAFGAGPRLEAKFALHMREAHRQGIKKAVWTGTQAGLLYFIAYSANALAYWQGSKEIAKNVANPIAGSGVTVGAIYTVVFLIVDACVMLGAIAPLLPLFGSASAAFVKLRKDIEQPSRINGTTDDGEKLPPNTAGGIEFRNVTFSYPSRPDNPVLKNISFTCPAGKYTALVGLSGSGKSTIAGLSTRLYDPHQGEVIMDGHDVRSLNVRNLRSFISLVQQEPSLLDRSIVENIALGLVNSPNEAHDWLKPTLYSSKLTKLAQDVKGGMDLLAAAQSYGDDVVEIAKLVMHAADLADASNFITRLEHGYGTMVGSGGKLVSGGQRQRIALARALIRDPKILLLDEATASLDSASERRIQIAVENASKGRTLISIAHRLSTIKNADNIIVMNAGEIVEQGSHFELIARNGAYANLVNLQNLRPTDDDDAKSMPSVSKMSLDTIDMEKSALDADDIAKPASDKASDEKASKTEGSTETEVPELDRKRSGWQVTKSIGRMVRPNLLWIVLALIAAFIVGCTFTASGAIFGVAIGVSSPCNEPSYIRSQGAFLAGMFFMLAVVEFFANAISWSSFGYIAENLLYRIRVLSFRSLFQQDVEWHQSKDRNPSTLLSVITKDAAAIGGFSGSIMGTALAVIVNLIVAIVVSHIIAWKIAIVCLVLLPILLGSGIMQLRTLTKFEAKHAEAYAEAVGITVEAVNSMKTVSTLSLEHEVLGTFKRALSEPKKDILTASTWANVWLAISNGVGNMIYAFAYWWGSKQIIAGNNTQTEFLIILVAMMVGASLWGQMFTLAPEVSKAKSAAVRIFNLLDLSPATSATGQTPVLPSPKDTDVEATAVSAPKPAAGRGGVSVTFRDVSFAYPARPEHQILQDMSLTIQPGQFCGLVGPSGAGKSTIMALVQRMYRASSGSVEIDGQDISRLDGTEFRDDMAVVPQDSALFDGSVKFNVGLGARPGQEATHEEIVEACKLANIHDTIMGLPEGYDTECGPNGSQLSGGQRQRVAIARALVRKPRLLLLDESTSALDAESERALQDGLEKAARGITVIAIAHRLHTVRKADVIFMCDNGAVVAKGRHEELMEKSETYRVNAMQQMLGH